MRILLSNDDGIGAPGILLLEDIAREIAEEVYVVAPDTNMSGAGHSLTFKTPLRLKEYDDYHFSVNGTPTDSVVMAVRHIMANKPDFMMSGINCDANLAEDITYSGTVAAAMEACLLGIPSIALSQQVFKNGSVNWEVVKKHGPNIIKQIIKNYEMPKEILLNINFPALERAEDLKGIRVTQQGFRSGEDHVIKSIDPRGNPYFWIGGAEYRRHDTTSDLDTDLGAINNDFISITPISLDLTADKAIAGLKEVFKS